MYGFVSWIEYDGKVFFLTDEEVFSPKGMGMFRLLSHHSFFHGTNSVIYHDAIREYFSLEPDQGTCCIQKDFWNTDTLPEPLDILLATPKSFLATWGRVFDGRFLLPDFFYIICHAPESYNLLRKKAWRRSLELDPRNTWLIRVIRHAPEPYAWKAWRRLFRWGNFVHNVELVSSDMGNSPEPYPRLAEKIYENRANSKTSFWVS